MTMKTLALGAALMSSFVAFAQPASAQGAVPVNFPPASFEGRQFVDNNGCVFVRAGVNGATTWVPRVTRQRSQVCGQSPTFGRTAAAPAAVAPAPAPRAAAPAPVQITTTPPAAAAPMPQQRSIATTSTPRRITAAPQPAPRTIMAPASKPAYAEPPRVVRRVPAVTAPASSVNTRVTVPARQACLNGQTSRIVAGRTVAMRCGPQNAPHVTTIRRGEAPSSGKNVHYNRNSWESGALAPHTRIVPRHVYEQQKVTFVGPVPHGFRPAWEDDRLNPYRAVQTVKGHLDTQRVWTNTVPRRLVAQGDVKVPFPRNLITPRYRHALKPATIVGRANQPYPGVHKNAYRDLGPVISSKGAAPVSSKGGWVEVGLFSSEAKGRAAIARLQSAGLPVRATKTNHQGHPMIRLRVGPYASTGALHAGLAAVHGTGYGQAYTR